MPLHSRISEMIFNSRFTRDDDRLFLFLFLGRLASGHLFLPRPQHPSKVWGQKLPDTPFYSCDMCGRPDSDCCVTEMEVNYRKAAESKVTSNLKSNSNGIGFSPSWKSSVVNLELKRSWHSKRVQLRDHLVLGRSPSVLSLDLLLDLSIEVPNTSCDSLIETPAHFVASTLLLPSWPPSWVTCTHNLLPYLIQFAKQINFSDSRRRQLHRPYSHCYCISAEFKAEIANSMACV